MIKRLLDITASLFGLLALSPLLVPVMVLIFLQDHHSPFYIAPRVGRGGRQFQMIKLRSMVANADKVGGDSTASNDHRITAIGAFIRRFKLDEIPQLWNVLKGDMSLVGPRPNVQRETDLYTEEERHLLDVRPGITDLASIVFADEGEILKDHPDPDLGYNQLIRPWKSRLGLLYVKSSGLVLDLRLIVFTLINVMSREKALAAVEHMLKGLNTPEDVIRVSRRQSPLVPHPPPGSEQIVMSRS
ncbi:MAG: sugar transferase [Nitrospinaceae bacterium]